MSRVVWRGVTLDKRMAEQMTEVARNTGSIYVNPTQGSYSGSVAASAGTHAGGGAIDLMHPSWSVSDYDVVVREMRRVGIAAWHRTPQQANWPRHVHGISVQPGGKGDRGVLSSGAHSQVVDYYEGRNGLASRAGDDGPRQFVGMTWEKYEKEKQAMGDFQHHKGTRAIPAGKWVTVNAVKAIRQGPALYLAQFAIETQDATLLRVRFNRNGKDGTGDQSYRIPRRKVWNTTHVHAVQGGFDGEMQVQIRVNKPVKARYRIAKSIKV